VLSSYGSGRATVSEGDWFLAPRLYLPDGTRRGVVYCHGAGASTSGLIGANTANQYALIQAIGAAFPTVVCDLGGTATWGNATVQARIDAAWTWLQTAYGVKTDKVLLAGFSMGNLAAFNYAIANPTKVAAIAGFLPASDLADFYTNNRGGYQAAIGTAWSVTYPADLPGSANPTGNTSGINGLPNKAWYATDDTVVLPATVTTLTGSIGGTAVSLGAAGGHADSTVASIPTADATGFLAAFA
jgi:pimeloyl-ACP methyl ester carboxylesterase